MADVIKISSNSYKVLLSPGDIAGGIKPGMGEIEASGQQFTSGNTVTIEFEIDKDAADAIRYIASKYIDFSDEGIPDEIGRTMMSGFLNSPIPIAGTGRDRATVVDMTEEEIADIPNTLAELETTNKFTVTMSIPYDTPISLRFYPDAFGMDVDVVCVPLGADNVEHPCAYTGSIVILGDDSDVIQMDTFDRKVSSTFNDAKVAMIEKDDQDVKFATSIVKSLVTLQEPMRSAAVDVYRKAMQLIGWRTGKTNVDRAPDAPFVKKIYGISTSGKALQVIDMRGLTIEFSRWARFATDAAEGRVQISYIVGDVKFPSIVKIGKARKYFDIVVDDDKLTQYGPTATEYEGGEGFDGNGSFIFSHEDRRSVLPVKVTKKDIGLK